MSKKPLLVIVGLVCILAIGLASALVWYFNSDDRDGDEHPFVALLTPRKAAKDDWVRLKAYQGTVFSGSVAGTYTYFTGLHPLLEADTNSNAFHMRFLLSRCGDTATVSVGSAKAPYVLDLDCAKHAVSRRKSPWVGKHAPPWAEVVSETYLLPNRTVVTISLGRNPKNREERTIGFNYPSQDKKDVFGKWTFIPYQLGADYGGAFLAFVDYPIGVIERRRDEQTVSLMLCDVSTPAVLAEIPVPTEAAGRPYFILDKKQDLLLACDIDYNSIVLVDLRSLVRHERNQTAEVEQARLPATAAPKEPEGDGETETVVVPLVPPVTSRSTSGGPENSTDLDEKSTSSVPYKPSLIIHCRMDAEPSIYHLAGCVEIRPDYVALPIACLSAHRTPCPLCRPPSRPRSELAGWTESDRRAVFLEDPSRFEEVLARKDARSTGWSSSQWAAWLELNRDVAFRRVKLSLERLVDMVDRFLPAEKALAKLAEAGIPEKEGQEHWQSAVVGLAERLAESGCPPASVVSVEVEVLAWRRAWAAQLSRERHREQQAQAFLTVHFVKILDVTTLLVKADAGEAKVRLLGIVPPTGGDLAQKAGMQCLAKLLATPVVELEFDEKLGREAPDGIRQAWVWVDGRLVNQELVRLGHVERAPETKTGMYWAAFYGDP